MKSMSYFLALPVWLLNAGVKPEQTKASEKPKTFPFQTWLTELKTHASIRQLKAAIDTIKQCPNQHENAFSPFSLTDSWQLTYFEYLGWDEQVNKSTHWTSQHCASNNFTHQLTGKAILDSFEIADSMVAQKFPLSHIPAILSRDALFNGEWAVISPSNDYLIVRMVHSYPNDNARSWYHEWAYYFKRHL